jgi:hypothetical protein
VLSVSTSPTRSTTDPSPRPAASCSRPTRICSIGASRRELFHPRRPLGWEGWRASARGKPGPRWREPVRCEKRCFFSSRRLRLEPERRSVPSGRSTTPSRNRLGTCASSLGYGARAVGPCDLACGPLGRGARELGRAAASARVRRGGLRLAVPGSQQERYAALVRHDGMWQSGQGPASSRAGGCTGDWRQAPPTAAAVEHPRCKTPGSGGCSVITSQTHIHGYGCTISLWEVCQRAREDI